MMQPFCEYCGSPMIAVKTKVSKKKGVVITVKCVGCGAKKEVPR